MRRLDPTKKVSVDESRRFFPARFHSSVSPIPIPIPELRIISVSPSQMLKLDAGIKEEGLETDRVEIFGLRRSVGDVGFERQKEK